MKVWTYFPPWKRSERWTCKTKNGLLVKDRDGNPVLVKVWQRVMPVRLIDTEEAKGAG